jgi:hypothetical protein
MVVNNLFGFTGTAVFARYLVTPLIVVWVLYLVIKVTVTDSASLDATPPDLLGGLGYWALVGIVIGVLTWGNEPDIFRYGKPKFWSSLLSFALRPRRGDLDPPRLARGPTTHSPLAPVGVV